MPLWKCWTDILAEVASKITRRLLRSNLRSEWIITRGIFVKANTPLVVIASHNKSSPSLSLTSCSVCVQQVPVLFWMISYLSVTLWFSVDPHSVSAARQWITSWWGVSLLWASYEFFIFLQSKFPSLPELLIISCFCLSLGFFFSSPLCLIPPNIFIGFLAAGLFHYLETGGDKPSSLGWTWSSCQISRRTRRLRCISVWMFEQEIFWILWRLKDISHRKKTEHGTTHTCRKPGNDSQRPLTFDVWQLGEWSASWGLVDLQPSFVYLPDGRGERAWKRGGVE